MRVFIAHIGVVFILLMITGFASGQCQHKLTGRIKDKETKLALSYVTIKVSEKAILLNSDSLGKFQFDAECDSTYHFNFYRIGFLSEEKSIYLTADTTIDIFMEFSPSIFNTVEIQSNKTNGEKTNATMVVDEKDLRLNAGNNLGGVLKNKSGLDSYNTGNGISKPILHGLHSNRLLILNNGIRQEGQQWGNEHAPEIDPFIANKITIVKGSNAIRYGHDAIAGVIIIEPKSFRSTPGINGEFQNAFVSNGKQYITSGMIAAKMKKLPALTLRAQGTFKKSGNVKTPDYFLKNTGIREWDYALAAGYVKEKFSIQLYYSQFNTEIGIFSGSHIGNLTDLYQAINAKRPTDTSSFSYQIGRPYQHIEHELFKAKVDLYGSDNWKLSLIYGRQFNLRNEFDKHVPRNDSLAALNLPELDLHITTQTADLSWEGQISKNFTTQIGLNSILQKNTYSGRFFIPNYIQQGIGGFLVQSWSNNHAAAEIGLRYDMRSLDVYMNENNVVVKTRYTNDNPVINLGYSYKWKSGLTIKLNAANAWRAPQASELYSNGLHHGAAVVEIGNKNLKKEQSYNLISSINYDRKNVSFEFTPYYNVINDFIYLRPTLPATLTIRGAFPTFTYKQADVRLKGIDFSAQIQSIRNLELSSVISILRAWNETDNQYLIQMPSDKYQLGMEYSFKNKLSTYLKSIRANYTYVNKQWRVPPSSDYLTPPSAYDLLSITLQSEIKIATQLIQISLTADNLLNKTYRDYMNRFRYYTDEPGRSLRFVVSIPFNKNYSDE